MSDPPAFRLVRGGAPRGASRSSMPPVDDEPLSPYAAAAMSASSLRDGLAELARALCSPAFRDGRAGAIDDLLRCAASLAAVTRVSLRPLRDAAAPMGRALHRGRPSPLPSTSRHDRAQLLELLRDAALVTTHDPAGDPRTLGLVASGALTDESSAVVIARVEGPAGPVAALVVERSCALPASREERDLLAAVAGAIASLSAAVERPRDSVRPSVRPSWPMPPGHA